MRRKQTEAKRLQERKIQSKRWYNRKVIHTLFRVQEVENKKRMGWMHFFFFWRRNGQELAKTDNRYRNHMKLIGGKYPKSGLCNKSAESRRWWKKILKATRDEKECLQMNSSYMAADFSIERMDAKRILNDAFIILKEYNFQRRIVYPIKIFFKNEAEIETFQIFYLLQ